MKMNRILRSTLTPSPSRRATAGVKLVLPNGDLLEVTDAQPDLMRLTRSSYCTFGVAYEVTYRIRPLLPMAVYHETSRSTSSARNWKSFHYA